MNKNVDIFIKIWTIIGQTIAIVGLLAMVVFVLGMQFSDMDMITRLILAPFTLCVLYTLGYYLCTILKKDNIANAFLKSYLITFFIYWFGFLGFATYSAIRDSEITLLVFLIPFYVIGAIGFYKYLIEK